MNGLIFSVKYYLNIGKYHSSSSIYVAKSKHPQISNFSDYASQVFFFFFFKKNCSKIVPLFDLSAKPELKVTEINALLDKITKKKLRNSQKTELKIKTLNIIYILFAYLFLI